MPLNLKGKAKLNLGEAMQESLTNITRRSDLGMLAESLSDIFEQDRFEILETLRSEWDAFEAEMRASGNR